MSDGLPPPSSRGGESVCGGVFWRHPNLRLQTRCLHKSCASQAPARACQKPSSQRCNPCPGDRGEQCKPRCSPSLAAPGRALLPARTGADRERAAGTRCAWWEGTGIPIWRKLCTHPLYGLPVSPRSGPTHRRGAGCSFLPVQLLLVHLLLSWCPDKAGWLAEQAESL